ncbi:MAG: hypothetical protein JOZ62_22970 [Acidobacteriaceae bacterium]|nr:hypothetical protein [Acidobacteriaceae bacterium]
MAQVTSQQSNATNLNAELSNIDYNRTVEQLRSLQNSDSIPGQYSQAVNDAVTILGNQQMENAFQQIQSRSGQGSQTMSAASGQGASSRTTSGRTGAAGQSGSGIGGQSPNE